MAGARRIAVVAAGCAIVAGGIAAGISLAGHGTSNGGQTGGLAPTPAERAAQRQLALEMRTVAAATSRVAIPLPTAPDQPAPAWSPNAFDAPLPAHEVFGFVPYYSLGQLTPADYRDATTIAYDGVNLTSGGAIGEQKTDLGWVAIAGTDFDSLVTEAHQSGDQVLLTVFTDTPKVIASLARQPVASGTRLAQQLQPLLADNRLDGVDIDVEGSGKADRAGFVAFMRAFTGALRSTDPSAVVVVDVYPGSAGDPRSFFDVKALAPLVDRMFVMAYDMYQPGQASPNAPLTSPDLGLSDVQTLLQYTRQVKPSKLLLGVPFYGYDFTTLSAVPGAAASSGTPPEAVTWQAIVGAAHRALWDTASDTPWYRFRLHGKWHETYFDDPASIALKTALAAQFKLAGVGVWALGMEAGDSQMLAALLGGSPPRKLKLTQSAVMSYRSERARRAAPTA
jgi:hypothetical protein